jgi:disulfide bond formation protein DsbB
MNHGEHVHFFPIIVLVGLILVALSFKLIFRFLVIFLIIIAIWYGLSWVGITSSPFGDSNPHSRTDAKSY